MLKYLVAIAFSFLLFSSAASAGLITYTFSGDVELVNDPDGLLGSILGIGVDEGDEFTGQFAIDENATPFASDFIITRSHFLQPGSGSFTTSVGGMVIDAPVDNPSVFINDGNANGFDTWGYAHVLNSVDSPSDNLFIAVQFRNFDGDLLNDEDFFLNTKVDIWDDAIWFIGQEFGLTSPGSDRDFIRAVAFGTVDSIAISTVPEPEGIVLMLLGLSIVGLRKTTKK